MKKVIDYWKTQYYVPRWFYSELRFGLTPEAQKGLETLPENKPCEECGKALWHCTCMVDCVEPSPSKEQA